MTSALTPQEQVAMARGDDPSSPPVRELAQYIRDAIVANADARAGG